MKASTRWEFESGSQYVRDADTGGTVLRVCEDDGHIDAKHAKPNDIDAIGKLAAAAPDLLAACKSALNYLEAYRPKGTIRENFSQYNRHENDAIRPLLAAIALAEGGKP